MKVYIKLFFIPFVKGIDLIFRISCDESVVELRLLNGVHHGVAVLSILA